MTNVAKLNTPAPEPESPEDRLAKMREPFAPHQISKLPKETKKQADERKADMAKGNWPARCTVCEGYHHPKAVHLDYVGHAALTDRLLDVDPLWSWEPVAYGPDGLPAVDRNGALWIKLTVCGVTRLGYGNADGKSGGDAVKEIIGDALRNAAMRFGAALDLWHKGDLHAEPEDAGPSASYLAAVKMLEGIVDPAIFKAAWAKNKDGWKTGLPNQEYVQLVAVMQACAAKLKDAESFRGGGSGGVAGSNRDVPQQPAEDVIDIGGDEIPW